MRTKVVPWILYVIVAVGVAGLAHNLGLTIWSAGRTSTVNKVRSPMTPINGIDVDANGVIYVGSEQYHRIQRFEPSGAFAGGLDVTSITSSGAFYFRVAGSGVLDIYSVRKRTLSRFGNGQVVTIPMQEYPHWAVHRREIDYQGRTYAVRGVRGFFERIIQLEDNQPLRTVIRDPVWLWLLGVPFPSLCLLILGLLGFFVRLKRRRRVSEEDQKGM